MTEHSDASEHTPESYGASSEVDINSSSADINSPEEQGTDLLFALLVTNMRLYDVALGIYTKLDPEAAKGLIEAHRRGRILGPVPLYTGEHVVPTTDEAETDEGSDSSD